MEYVDSSIRIPERLDAETIPGLLGRQADFLKSAFDLDGAVSTLLVALLLSAFIGPARWVRAPLGHRIPLNLNVAFVTRKPVVLEKAIRNLFEPLVNVIGNARKTAALQNREHH